MGVVNVTPDSFYDGGRFIDAKSAVAHGVSLHEAGAHILDIGGESSRPNAKPITSADEAARVLPVLEGLSDRGAILSIDTFHAETARLALEAGATMVNDITALQGDSAMAGVIAEVGCPCVLMHMQGTPETMQEAPHYDDVIDDIKKFFDERLNFATAEGIDEEKLWIDPGFGFGKTVDHNLTLLRRLHEFKTFGRPVLIGTSNKSTIGAVLDVAVDDRTEGTAATTAIAIAHGADAVRVHDVKTMSRVAAMTDAILRA